jgi:hypothetical protein
MRRISTNVDVLMFRIITGFYKINYNIMYHIFN